MYNNNVTKGKANAKNRLSKGDKMEYNEELLEQILKQYLEGLGLSEDELEKMKEISKEELERCKHVDVSKPMSLSQLEEYYGIKREE